MTTVTTVRGTHPWNDPTRQARPVEAWPEDDRRAWAAASQQGDILEPGGEAASWASATRRGVVKAYGRWLTWFTSVGGDLALSLGERVTQEAIATYVGDLRATVASTTVHTYLRALYGALQVMAPDTDWAWLRRVVARLDRAASPTRNKRLRVVPIDELYEYGIALMTEADAATSGTPLDRACQFRDGLIFALLAACPCLRLSNLAAIRIGRHLLQQGPVYRLRFTAAEMKSRRPIEAPVPTELVAYLEHYRSQHRQVLCQPIVRPDGTGGSGEPGQFLWVSRRRTGLGERAIYGCIVKWSKARFGRPLSPHLFRDSAATTIATDDPEHVRITASILGHSSLKTSEKHYNHAQSLEAARRHQENIAALRQRPRRYRQDH